MNIKKNNEKTMKKQWKNNENNEKQWKNNEKTM